MRPDVHSLIGAYVLNAVSAVERSDFEDHLDDCAACRSELDGLRAAAAKLAGEPLQPPAALRMRVLAATAQAPQQRRRPVYVKVLAVAAALVVIAGTAVGVRALTDDPTVTAKDVFAAEDAVVRTVQSPAGTAQVATSPQAGYAAIDLRGLRHAPSGENYQVWWIGKAKPHSVAVGPDTALVPLANGTLAVSIEPAGGSPQPTSDPILVTQISR